MRWLLQKNICVSVLFLRHSPPPPPPFFPSSSCKQDSDHYIAQTSQPRHFFFFLHFPSKGWSSIIGQGAGKKLSGSGLF
jgi:hypothetical protein